MSSRLFAAIAIPVWTLALVLTASVVDSHRDVRQAEAVATHIELLDLTVALRSALYKERLAAELFAAGRRPSTELLARTRFGAQLLDDPGSLVRATDDALAAIPRSERPIDAADLAEVRDALFDDPAAGSAGRFDRVDDALERAISADLEYVRRAAVELGDLRLIGSATAFETSVDLPQEAGILVAELADMWIAPPPSRPERQSRVAIADAILRRSQEQLTASIRGGAGGEPRRFEPAPPLPASLDAAIDRTTAGELTAPERPSSEPVAVGVALLDGVDWLLDVDTVPTKMAEVARADGRAVAASAREIRRRNAALAAAAVLGAFVTATLLGRSITRPVRRLTDQAERIGRGELDGDRLEMSGPPEVVRASRAMNDVVGNLALLEQKSHALATARFNHPALSEPLPGQLGESLQMSIEVLSDSIEQREALQARLRFDAAHDSLTGLCNRASVVAALDEMTAASTAADLTAAVFIDLNGFKGINDRYGHAGGDEVLRVAAERMLATAPARATVARLGGDEFVIAIPHVSGFDEPLEVARRVVGAISRPIALGARTVAVGASAGVAVSRPTSANGATDGPTVHGAESLLRMADLAVYTAKLDPATNVALYDDALDDRLTRQREMEAALRLAVASDRGELRLVFQPIVRAGDLVPKGVETLLRWERGAAGSVAPDEFIPLAERSDLILAVDDWVLHAALRQMARWVEDSQPPATISVNISGRTLLDPSFVPRVTDALASSGVAPGRLQLEVTETALVSDLELAAEHLGELRSLGVRVAIDDFGTGYTSIAHLRTLPVDELKIDSSFVQQIDDEDNRVLVEMIVQLAHHLGVPTVAEGVETAEQVAALREMGCDSLQGYFFSPPVEARSVVLTAGAVPAA